MLTRWDPFAEIARLQDQFARWAGSKEMPYAVPFAPAIDIYEDNDAIVVKAEVPGLRPDDVQISVEDNVLTLRGERKIESESEKREGFHRRERSYGAFSRSFTLPATVDSEHIEADLSDGVLTLRVPKKAAPEPKRIEIKSGASGRQPVKTGKPS